MDYKNFIERKKQRQEGLISVLRKNDKLVEVFELAREKRLGTLTDEYKRAIDDAHLAVFKTRISPGCPNCWIDAINALLSIYMQIVDLFDEVKECVKKWKEKRAEKKEEKQKEKQEKRERKKNNQ